MGAALTHAFASRTWASIIRDGDRDSGQSCYKWITREELLMRGAALINVTRGLQRVGGAYHHQLKRLKREFYDGGNCEIMKITIGKKLLWENLIWLASAMRNSNTQRSTNCEWLAPKYIANIPQGASHVHYKMISIIWREMGWNFWALLPLSQGRLQNLICLSEVSKELAPKEREGTLSRAPYRSNTKQLCSNSDWTSSFDAYKLMGVEYFFIWNMYIFLGKDFNKVLRRFLNNIVLST